MEEILGSVRRSLVFRNSQGEESGIAEKIGSCLRKSRLGFLSKRPLPTLPNSSPPSRELAPPIRWRKGELIGCGAFGRVYMGMNQDSGELLAVKQVSIATGNASKDKAQAHIRELEEEVKLLKNLSHPNIVRYLGTTRDDENLNIMLEFIPGGSISSLLGKFGPFPEAVIRNYTKQLLQGLEYLHQNGIIHRDIKGANILVDNKGCIKVADFGASKKVVELVTVSGAKSMKGTPYWMAPEVILQIGHSFSADIWSVGCTIIEMATGKPPWSEQYQEVAALFHIGTTRSHPPIPKHLSLEGNDFLLKCLQKEPSMRPTASDLLQHPFVAKEFRDMHSIPHPSVTERSTSSILKTEACMNNNLSPPTGTRTNYTALKDTCNFESLKCSNLWTSNDMCQLDEDFEVVGSQGINFTSTSDQFIKSFNPMMEPLDDWPCKFDGSPEQRGIDLVYFGESVDGAASISGTSGKGEIDFTFPCDPINEDDEIIESKIRAFLDEKALELKKLQTPLYEEFYSTLNASSSPDVKENLHGADIRDSSDFPSKTMSPSKVASGTSPRHVGSINLMSPGSRSRRISSCGVVNSQILREIPLPQLNEWRELPDNQQHSSPSSSYSERQRKWKEELDEELERERAMKRQAGIFGKTSFPMHRISSRKRDRLLYESISKNE